MAASPPSLYPDFAELCRQAREMEKNLLRVPPSQITGAIRPDESDAIFPREFEEYTYSYLLSEAHKIERRLFATKYESALSSEQGQQKAGTGQAALEDERQMEEKLHSLAAYSPKAAPAMPAQQKPGIAVPPLPISIPKVQVPSLQKKQGKAAPPPIPAAKPAEETQEEGVPLEAQEFEEEKELAAPSPEEEKPAAQVPGEEEPAATSPEGKRQFPVRKAPQEQVLIPEEEEVPLPEREVQPGEEGATPPRRPSPALSPRLRAIIEEKLRRDEEKERQDREQETPAEQAGQEEPAPGASGQEREEEVVLSSRERLLRKLRKEPAKTEDEISLQEREEPPQIIPQEEKEEEEPGGNEEAPAEEPPEKEIPTEQKWEAPVRVAPAQGGILIKPIFAGDDAAKAEKAGAPGQAALGQEERMRRIQRIMEELSPDKFRAKAVVPQMEEEQKPEERKGKKPAKAGPLSVRGIGEAEEAGSQAKGEKPAKARPAPALETGEKEEIPRENWTMPGEEEPAQELPAAPLQGQTVPPKKAPAKKTGRKKPVRQADGLPQKIPVTRKPAGKKSPLQRKAQELRGKALGQAQEEKKKAASAPAEKGQPPKPPARLRTQRAPAEKEQAREGPAGPRSPRPAARAPAEKEQEQEFPRTLVKRQQAPAAQGAVAASPVPGARILPGGVKLAPKPGIGTYVQPARQRTVLQAVSQEPEPEQEKEEPRPQYAVPRKQQRPSRTEEEYEKTRPSARKAAALEEEEPELSEDAAVEKTQEEKGEEGEAPAVPRAVLEKMEKAVPKKAASDEPVEKTPEELEEERQRSQTARKFEAKLRAFAEGKKAGAAREGEGEPEVPAPPQEEAEQEEVPRPEDYEAAKQEFKQKMEAAEVREAAKAESEEMLEQYAKENVVWLYEIYKMGGMSREDFLQKVREKAAEEKQAEKPPPSAPENPALASINKEIDKRAKKEGI